MSICNECHQEMLKADGCTIKKLKIRGKTYNRVKFHESYDGERCPDCNVKNNEFHHLGCDWEVCPKCGGQLISCFCN